MTNFSEKARLHWERASQFRAHSRNARSPDSSAMYLYLLEIEEALVEETERLSRKSEAGKPPKP